MSINCKHDTLGSSIAIATFGIGASMLLAGLLTHFSPSGGGNPLLIAGAVTAGLSASYLIFRNRQIKSVLDAEAKRIERVAQTNMYSSQL